MPSPNDDKDQNLQTVNDQAKPAPERVPNAEGAWSIYDRIKQNHAQLSIQHALIQAQQDGNAPYTQGELEAQGMGWMSNVNFGRSRATIRLNSTSVWNMFTSVPMLLTLKLNDSTLKDPQEPSMDYASIIEEEYTRILMKSPDFYYNLLMRIREMLLFGNGPVFWRDEFNWKSEFLKTANFMYPPKTKANPTALELCCIRDEISPRKILKWIEDEEAARDEGWNLDEVKQVLVGIYRKGQKDSNMERYSESEWMSAQIQLKNMDFDAELADMNGVKVVHMLVAEVETERVTHLIFLDDPTPSQNGADKKRQFMYKREEKYPNMLAAVNNLIFDIGNGYLRSVRGLAYELYPTDDIGNRVINSILDGVMMVSGLLIQPGSGGDHQNMNLMKKGPVTIVPEGLTVIQSSFAPPIDKSIQALDLVNRIQNNNAGVHQNKSEDVVSREPRSATEVEIEATNEARFERTQSTWYYIQWDLWHQETFRRLINSEYPKQSSGYEDHEQFIKRCKDRGVPDSMLNADVWDATATRSIGLGSPVMAQRLTSWLLGILPQLDERGRLNAKRDAIMVRFGPDKVDRYAPLQDRNKILTSEHSVAALETNDFSQGQKVPAGVDQPHTIHMDIHMGPLFDLAKRFEQNPASVDVIRVATLFQISLEHIAAHLQFLAQDPTRKNQVKEYQLKLQQLVSVFQKIAGNVRKLEQEKKKRIAEMEKKLKDAEGQEMQKEIAIELGKARMKMQVDLKEAEMLNESRIAKLQASIQATIQKAIADVRREDYKAAKEVIREDAKAISEINRSGAKG